MSPSNFQGYNHQIIMSRRINPALKINPGSHFIKKSSSPSPPPSPPLPPSPPSVLHCPAATVAVGGPRHPVIIYTHSPKVIRVQPKDFMALVQKLTGNSAPVPASAPPSPPPPMPEPCDEYLIAEIATKKNNNNNTDHTSSDTNKSSSDDVISARYDWLMREDSNKSSSDDVIGARNNWLMMDDKDSTTSVVMDEKEGSCSIGQGFDPRNNSKFHFDNNNEFMNNNNMPYLHPTSLDFRGFPSPAFDNCGDSLHLMRSSIVSSPPPSLVTKGSGSTGPSSPASVMDFPDFLG